ncbi:MAG: hypothetical protein KC620_21065 [Myxococcales bacterium]|nr:hypothetical protein [Myxococcales bacterium]
MRDTLVEELDVIARNGWAKGIWNQGLIGGGASPGGASSGPAKRGGMRLLIVVLLWASAGMAAPAVQSGDADRLAAAESELRAALARLDADPAGGLKAAEAALDVIASRVDAYFHGSNLTQPKMRAQVLALRRVVQPLMAGADSTLVLRDDVLRVRPAIHRALALAAARAGDAAAQVRHRRAALAGEGATAANLNALAEACTAAGDAACASAAKARAAGLKAAEGE